MEDKGNQPDIYTQAAALVRKLNAEREIDGLSLEIGGGRPDCFGVLFQLTKVTHVGFFYDEKFEDIEKRIQNALSKMKQIDQEIERILHD